MPRAKKSKNCTQRTAWAISVCVYVCSTKNGPLFIFTPFHIQDQHRKTARLFLCIYVYEERKKSVLNFNFVWNSPLFMSVYIICVCVRCREGKIRKMPLKLKHELNQQKNIINEWLRQIFVLSKI